MIKRLLTRIMAKTFGLVLIVSLFLVNAKLAGAHVAEKLGVNAAPTIRERTSLNAGWSFSRFTSNPDGLSYNTLKPWILPSSNDFILDGTKYQRPSGTSVNSSLKYVQSSFDDSAWEMVNLPHDWAIKGPFNAPNIPTSMGALPVNGIGWYRRNLTITSSDLEKSVFLDIDGAMSYSAVWLNEELVGGWPYGYASFRLDLTPYIREGENILAIRLDNPLNFSRWYPGAGIYRNVWLVKADRTHVGQYGTHVTTSDVSAESATLDLTVEVENKGNASREIEVSTEIYLLDEAGQRGETVIATYPSVAATIAPGGKQSVNGSVTIASPLLWGPPPAQKPNLYVAVTTLSAVEDGAAIDSYETQFGIRSVVYDANKGIFVNGQALRVQGTNNHHDLGSLGAAFNVRAAERQLEILQEMGCNALRMSHNPPAPELLELADKKGFLVMDEAFDVWNRAKVTNDYHLLFEDWHEQDLRSFIRRDRNHPSIVAWSFGNEISEQTDSTSGALGRELHDIVRAEDPTRFSTAAMNVATAGSAFANVPDIKSLNYQGEGLGTSYASSFPSFHAAYPDSLIWTSESASALSTRGTYIFPVASANSTTASSNAGEDPRALYVSAYELYATAWGSSPDKVFSQQDKYPYAAGEFVWTGFDYLGEPTPYGTGARSSYFGIIDLAGFKKDRFYLYQARWRPDLVRTIDISLADHFGLRPHPAAHILPHWTWPNRVGQVTPVHVFSAADEAELFVNNESAGRLTRSASNYRFRWDRIVYEPGELHVVTYKDGVVWAEDTVKTVGDPVSLNVTADRTEIVSDGYDLSYITVAVVDANGDTVPDANNNITFSSIGGAEIIATDNGDPTDTTVFPSLARNAFNGLALAIVRANAGETGEIIVSAAATRLDGAQVTLQAV
ncbi:glycoside hydrolase [Xylariaceae sp. FL1272]|nr:glycoside hydrolase [Xylariaceae sp. FL1272]